MTDPFDRLRVAVASSYEILREVGRGGMARVFLARDLRHPRQVAVKLLNPDIAAAVGPERFLREIGLTASLTHPHILPLLDSGHEDGLLYYVMPYIEGETLRTRLTREEMIPIAETVAIARQVGDALAYAHMHGIIHRDVKPENILLAGAQAMVADFGVGRAIGEAGGERLTETGLALGTVVYMSPEQAVGDPHIDGRTDQYSLACVVYEMLVGQPPFTGRDSRAIVARHTLDPVPPIRTQRPTVPAALEGVVLQALAKLPVDRYQTVTAFVEALEKAATAPATPLRPAARPARFRSRGWLAGILAAGVLAVSGILLQRGCGRSNDTVQDPDAVAILPFRVSGTVDTSLIRSEGLGELLFTKLSGSSGQGLHAVDPGKVFNAWRHASPSASAPLDVSTAVQVARRVGAGQVLIGQAFGTTDSITLSGRLLAVPSGRELQRIDGVSGKAEQLLGLLDQFSVQLLARSAGGSSPRLADLYTRSPEALRAFLAGADLYRHGHYSEAADRYRRAIQLDSTFALAGLELAATTGLSEEQQADVEGIQVAWAHQDRLSPGGRLFLRAMAGVHYPQPSTALEDLHFWELTVDSIPDRWEASYMLGDLLFHYGAALGRQSSQLVAGNAFRRALQGDSVFAPALEHLIDLAAMDGDTTEVRRLVKRYFAVDSLGDRADFIRWRAGLALQDGRLRDRVLERLPQLSDGLLERIRGAAQLDGVGLDDAQRAADELRSRARNARQLLVAGLGERELAINLGRPDEALPLPTDRIFEVPFLELFEVVDALFWDGDSASAARAVDRRRAALRPPPADGSPDWPGYMDFCTVGLWEAAAGQWSQVADRLLRLGTARRAGENQATRYIAVCKAVLSAELAAAERRGSGAELARLDSLMQTFPAGNAYILLAGNLTVAQLREATGDVNAALAAVRRRMYYYDSFGVAGLSTMLREEGRLAALSGDREGAIQAYQHYLRLRRKPDPRLVPQVAGVRRALAELSPDVASQAQPIPNQ